MRKIVFYELLFKRRFILLWVAAWVGFGALFIALFQPIQRLNSALVSFSSVEVFLGGNFVSFYLLVAAVTSAIWGSSAIWGKISNGTITTLLTTGYSRMQIFFSLAAANFAAVILRTVPVFALLYLFSELAIGQLQISMTFFAGAALLSVILELFFLSLGMLAGASGTDLQTQVPVAYAVSAWIIGSLSTFKGFPQVLNVISPFYYLDLPHLIADLAVNSPKLLILGTITGVCLFAGSLLFVRKNIHLEN